MQWLSNRRPSCYPLPDEWQHVWTTKWLLLHFYPPDLVLESPMAQPNQKRTCKELLANAVYPTLVDSSQSPHTLCKGAGVRREPAGRFGSFLKVCLSDFNMLSETPGQLDKTEFLILWNAQEWYFKFSNDADWHCRSRDHTLRTPV